MSELLLPEEAVFRLQRELDQKNIDLTLLQQQLLQQQQDNLELSESELQFRIIFHAAPDAIVIINDAGNIELVNAQTERLFAYGSKELIGQPIEVLLPPEIWATHRTHRAQFLQKPYTRLMGEGRELFACTKSGEKIAVEVSLSPLQTQMGLLVTAAIRDIRIRKQVEAELDQYRKHLEERVVERTAALSAANKELEAFSYTISHDLRAPLRSIDGFSLALAEDYADNLPQPAKDYLQRIRGATQRMDQLINDVLQLARVGRGDLSKQSVDLTKLAKDILGDLQVNDPTRKVTLHVGDNMCVSGDAQLLRVVLENLLHNAWKFTARKDLAEIRVDSRVIGNITTFYVKDNGAGLDMRQAKKLFGVFQRFHSEKDFKGTGVGLATVQRIIQRHKGQVWVESAPDQGLTMYFTLSDAALGTETL